MTRQLLRKIKYRMKNQKGFSLAELLMTIMILLLVSLVVATGIPAATRSYKNVKEASDAQMLFSTAMAQLRSELDSATKIEINGTEITYKNSLDIPSKIYLNSEDNNEIYLSLGEGTVKQERPIVTEKTSGDNLTVTYTSVSLNDAKDVIRFSDFRVKNSSGTVLAVIGELGEDGRSGEYDIRILTN